jgi:hypothetical protein
MERSVHSYARWLALGLLVALAVPTAQAQSRTTFELGGGGVAMRADDGWAGPIGIGGHIGIRRGISRRAEARVGMVGFRRSRGDTPRRIAAAGLTAEVAVPLNPRGTVLVGGGAGLFAVDIYDRYFDDAVGISTGAAVLVGTVGTRHVAFGSTMDLRVRVLYGDLGTTGRTTIIFGVVFAP